LVPSQQVNSALGYMLCLLSVLIYAMFEVTYKLFEHLLSNNHSAATTTTVTEPKTAAAAFSETSAAAAAAASSSSSSSRGPKATTVVVCVQTSVNAALSDVPLECGAEVAVVPQKSQQHSSSHDDNSDSKLDLLTPMLGCLKFLGLMGVYTCVSVGPFVYVLDVTGAEEFHTPFTDCEGISCFSYILIDGALDLLYNICLLVGISLTSPRFMSAGTIMIIPVGVAVEIVKDPTTVWNPWAIVGCVTIVLSFVVMEFMEGFVAMLHARYARSCPQLPGGEQSYHKLTQE
jgi:hypothetical protein